MFERFTDGARRVVVLAQQEAKLLNHNYIGTEHILLGLLGCDQGSAQRALSELGVSLEAVREQVEDIIGRGDREPNGHIPFTPRAKKVLELALREMLQLSQSYIGTEHILLGLIREGEGVAAQVLIKLGHDLSQVRAKILEVIGQSGSQNRPPAYEALRRLVIELPLGTKPADVEVVSVTLTYRDAAGDTYTQSSEWLGEGWKTIVAREPTPEPGETATN